MNLWLKGAAIALTATTIGLATTPAQAQYHGYRDGWRGGDHRWVGDRRWDGNRRWDRRRDWNNRRYYRGYRQGWRPVYRGWRQQCWTEWRRGYWGQRVRVRVCR